MGTLENLGCEMRVSFFMLTASTILANHDDELGVVEIRGHMRIAVYWRCWSAVAQYLDVSCYCRMRVEIHSSSHVFASQALATKSVTAEDFVVTRAARVIQRAWRERRRR